MKKFWKVLGVCMMAVSDNARYYSAYNNGVNFANNEIIKNYVNGK